jgi:NAD(P)-dependent dehydrogenase (short-subunit alcohol dehydrogenase family)
MTDASKVAVVTGAGTGIGRAATLALLENGWHVALAGRRREPLETTASGSGGAAERTLVVPTDVANPEAVRALFGAVRQRFGRLDLLFNNAGTNVPGVPLEDLAYEQWRAVVDVNLTGMFLCAQAAFRMMKAQDPRGGRIVNNGSISAHVPRPHSAAYTATKHGVTGLTKSIALDGRPYDITCCQIDVGNARTDLTARMAGGVPQADGSMAPEPVMDVEHVGRMVAHVAGLPRDVSVPFVTIMAAKMPFMGRG